MRKQIMQLRIGAQLMSKRLLSYRKQQWEFEDYPIIVRRQTFDVLSDDADHESRYWARILGWLIDALAPTKAEALVKLRENYELRKQSNVDKDEPIPRPGVRVPIQFASQERVDADPELAKDFIQRVLQLEWALITDESSLWDFTLGQSIKELQDRVFLLYGVAVYEIEDGKIAAILEKIVEGRRSVGEA